MRGFALCFNWFFDREFNVYLRFRTHKQITEPEATMLGLYPPAPSPRSGARGRKRDGITQIHWDFESGVLRNVGKVEAASL